MNVSSSIGEMVLVDISNLVITSQPMEEATEDEKNGLRQSMEELGLLYPLLLET